MSELKCENCPYFWAESEDTIPFCHWESKAPDDTPPCEEDNRTEEKLEEHFFVLDSESMLWREVPIDSAECNAVNNWEIDTDGEGRIDYYADDTSAADIHDYMLY